MSLEKDITIIKQLVEAKPIFKAASNDQLKARGYTGKEYSIFIGDMYDGTVSDKDTAIRIARGYKYPGVRVYEVPVGSGMARSVNGRLPVIVFPVLPEIVAEAKPIFKAASPEQLAIRKSIRDKDLAAMHAGWAETARLELSQLLAVEITYREYEYYEGLDAVAMEVVNGKGSNGESAWIVFASLEEAEMAAYRKVGDDLRMEPGIFEQSWLQNFIEISATDKSMLAGEEADDYVDNVLSDEEILEEAGVKYEYDELQEQLDNLDTEADDAEILDKQAEILDNAKETIRSRKQEEIERALEDPVEYFVNERGIYTIEDLFKAAFIQINVDDAAEDAVATDGIDKWLDNYDSAGVELPSGAIAYGTN